MIGFPRLAGMLVGEYAASDRGRWVGARYRDAICAGRARLIPRGVALQGNLDPLALVAGGAAMGGNARRSWTRCGGGRLSSIWGMASCRRRRRSTWRNWWSWCVRPRPFARHRPVQPGRPGPAGGDQAVPGQPVQRPGDPARAVLRASVPGPADRRAPGWLRRRANYALLGGKSPLLELTQQQARGAGSGTAGTRREVLHRHALLASVQRRDRPRGQRLGPDEVVLLPLYPQYSTTTTGSSLTAWREAAARSGWSQPTTTRLLLSRRPGLCRRHGRAGATAAGRQARAELDPADAVAGAVLGPWPAGDDRAGAAIPTSGRSSRRWPACVRQLGSARARLARSATSRAPRRRNGSSPSTEAEIERAAHDKVALLVVPIAFVSEHSETLVELDVEYRTLAETPRRAGLFPCAGAEFRSGVHRGTGGSGAARQELRPWHCAATLAIAFARPIGEAVPMMLPSGRHERAGPCDDAGAAGPPAPGHLRL